MLSRDDALAFGDYVTCGEPPHRRIGRVTNDVGAFVFVCFEAHCDAEMVAKRALERADAHRARLAPIGLGGHRFDDEPCPDYDPAVCALCQVRLGIDPETERSEYDG